MLSHIAIGLEYIGQCPPCGISASSMPLTSINVMYTVDGSTKRAVGFKLSEGMDVPAELASRFKFAGQKSKLAGTIRSFFNIKNEY